MNNSLFKNPTVQNYGRVFFSTSFYRGTVVIIGIILSRVLTPTEVGFLAISFFLINIFKVFINNGIGEAIVYEREDSREIYDTAFTLSLSLGAVFYAVLFFIAPLFAGLFREDIITTLIRLLGLYIIFSAIGRVQAKTIEKELDFRTRIIPEISSALVFLIVLIALVRDGYGIYAFVYGFLASVLTENLLLVLLSRWKPKIGFRRHLLKKIINYAIQIFFSSILIYLLVNIDDFFVGKIAGLTLLGYYTTAYLISNTPATQITHIANRIMFPTYAKVRDSISRFRRTYLLNLELVSIGSFLLTALIFIYIPEVIHLVLGDRWMPAALPIRILCFSGIIRSVTATTGELFKAVGKPHYLKRYSFYQLLILLAIIIPAIYLYGLVGACLAVIIPKLAVQGFAIAKVCKIIRIRMSGFFSRLVNPTISVLLMSLISLPLKNLLAGALPGLVFSIVISVSIYAAAIMILRKGLIRDISML